MTGAVVESAALGTATTGLIGILALAVSKCKCFCKCNEDNVPTCACGFTKNPIVQDENELIVKTVTVNNVDFLYVGKCPINDTDN